MPAPIVKICGLYTPAALEAALAARADMVGFVFFAPSPRNISLDAARRLGERAAGVATKVALTVDADDELMQSLLSALQPDLLQLHGAETPQRVAEIRRRYKLPVMKAIGISSAADVGAVAAYVSVADRILFDAKPPTGATRPGGNGLSFDWRMLANLNLPIPWMLSGGLDADNVGEALRITGAPGVDVSSGVESAPGVKDLEKIHRFVRAARLGVATTPGGA